MIQIQTWRLVVFRGVATAAATAVTAPFFDNDPLDMAFVGFFVGVLLAPVQMAVLRRAIRAVRANKDG